LTNRLAEVEAENARLIAKLAEVEAERDIWRDFANMAQIADRRVIVEATWRAWQHHVTDEMRQRMMLQAQAQNQQFAVQQAMQQRSDYQQGLSQMNVPTPFMWHDCTCVPGRSALLRGDN
jgi:hypothetical protein